MTLQQQRATARARTKSSSRNKRITKASGIRRENLNGKRLQDCRESLLISLV